MITQELLLSNFYYKDGSVYWRIDKNYRAKKDQIAGCLPKGHRYRLLKVNNKAIPEHRAIFLMMNGYLPQFIDHIDGNAFNNNLSNLREATCVQNQYNSKLRKDSTSNIKNVRWHKASNSWMVCVRIEKKEKYFGIYKDIELAELVAMEVRSKYHKEFARHK